MEHNGDVTIKSYIIIVSGEREMRRYRPEGWEGCGSDGR